MFVFMHFLVHAYSVVVAELTPAWLMVWGLWRTWHHSRKYWIYRPL